MSCADCALKLEKHLSGLKDVEHVSINFASASILLDCPDIELIKSAIKDIEPEVELSESMNDYASVSWLEMLNISRNELFIILFAILVFIIGLIFKEKLEQTKGHFAEYLVFLSVYLITGWRVLLSAAKNILKGNFFDEHFLMSIATIGAIIIYELPEAAGVMVFYRVGLYLENLSVNKSRRSIKSLLKIKPETANLLVDKNIKIVDPLQVKVGDILVVHTGEKIPLDGEIIEGEGELDTSALTGEFLPKHSGTGDQILAGMILNSGSLKVKVSHPFEESSVARILDLVENASSRKAETEKFITRFARIYSPIVVFISLCVAILPPIFVETATFEDWIYRALVVLVVSCPCALVISIPLGYFVGIGSSSKRGILIKGSNFLESLSRVKTVIFDKTGTLTNGNFTVSEIKPFNSFSGDEILYFAALAESGSNHPIAKSIVKKFGKDIDSTLITNYEEISGYGIRATIDGQEIIAGNDKMLHKFEIEHEQCQTGTTVVHVVIGTKYAGWIEIGDTIKDESPRAIADLNKLGITDIIMLTGDNSDAAEKVAGKLNITKVYSNLLPEQKVEFVENCISNQQKDYFTAFVGDGINDAPVISRADVGIAMGALGSDLAVESADVVLMTDNPTKVATAVQIARKTRKIVWQNIQGALAVKGIFILLGIFGFATMWEAVFADVGVTVLAVLNTTRVLSIRG